MKKKIKNGDKKKYASPKELEKVEKEYNKLSKKAMLIFCKKSMHWKNIFLKRGILGILTRMEDKIHDVEMGGKGKENVTECFLDLANYAIQGAIINERNKKAKKK